MATPNYYKLPNGGDLWDIFTDAEKDVIARFNVIKYTFRAGKKPSEDEVRDYKKAVDYLTERIAAHEAKAKAEHTGVYEVIITYTDGSTEPLTFSAIDAYDAECQAASWHDGHKFIKEVGTARELTPREKAARRGKIV